MIIHRRIDGKHHEIQLTDSELNEAYRENEFCMIYNEVFAIFGDLYTDEEAMAIAKEAQRIRDERFVGEFEWHIRAAINHLGLVREEK